MKTDTEWARSAYCSRRCGIRGRKRWLSHHAGIELCHEPLKSPYRRYPDR